MTIKEIEKGCGRTFDIDDPNYITFCGVTCHTQHPNPLGIDVDLCQDCEQRWKFEKFKEDLRQQNVLWGQALMSRKDTGKTPEHCFDGFFRGVNEKFNNLYRDFAFVELNGKEGKK